MIRRTLALCLAVGTVLGVAGVASAQELTNEQLKAQIDRQGKQIEMLTQQLQKMQMTPTSPPLAGGHLGNPAYAGGGIFTKDDVKSIVTEYLQEKEKIPAPKGDEPYRVGSDLAFKASWADGFTYYTANKDFTGHIGGWVQYDNVFYDQSHTLITPQSGTRAGKAQGVASGPGLGGIGDLEDGTYFRRIRLMTDGTFWENYEYTLVLALENNQFSTVGLDEFWIGAKNIPGIGTVRIGHVKNCIGLEADMASSSRTMTFMERSAYSEAIELNQNFVTGIWVGNSYLDQRTTWSGVAFRPDQGSSSGVYFGDGQWGMQGRLTGLPLYENDGRCLMHVGLSGGWRNGQANLANSPLRTFQLRARPELRDDDPGGSPGGAQAVPNANSNRLIDTGVAVADNQWLMGLEYLAVLGPLSVQAEYGWNWLEDAVGFAPSGLKLNPALPHGQNYIFSGGYIQLAYTLTGEHRSYDKRLGRLDSYYFGRQGNYTNAWFVKDENGGLNWGLGAWEIAARYGYVNLNDGTGLNRIQGGIMESWTVGLNWYLNNNLKFQFDYIYDHRDDTANGVNAGYVQGLGVRMQFMY
jgi:phosphate-selective porin OprO/OprP